MVWRAVSTRFSRSSPTAIDEAREGYGKKITVTRYLDYSVQVEDHGRGIPVDYNPKEERYNWELRVLRAVRRRQIQHQCGGEL